ncbi:MAG: hypothetical protein NXI22_23655 [bacterium]|nr:hypothetical protein [bacterium]
MLSGARVGRCEYKGLGKIVNAVCDMYGHGLFTYQRASRLLRRSERGEGGVTTSVVGVIAIGIHVEIVRYSDARNKQKAKPECVFHG